MFNFVVVKCEWKRLRSPIDESGMRILFQIHKLISDSHAILHEWQSGIKLAIWTESRMPLSHTGWALMQESVTKILMGKFTTQHSLGTEMEFIFLFEIFEFVLRISFSFLFFVWVYVV